MYKELLWKIFRAYVTKPIGIKYVALVI